MASVEGTVTLEFTKECRELLEGITRSLDSVRVRIVDLETHSHPSLPVCSHTRALDLERAVKVLANRCGIDGDKFIATIRREREST